MGSKQLVAGTLGGSAVLAAALSLATPEIMRWEGKRNDPYRDIVGVLTVCYGETQATMRRYSDAECATMLTRRVEQDYARPILACVPGFATRAYPFAAAISLSYNIGTAGFCRSTAARQFNAGNWADGCDAFLPWNKAGGRVIAGLARRREAERQICLKGAA
ncbi:MAG TPA: lysozyme [Sphingobium sp.]|uniref:lysozyme n=1 Tax=Sphingobium sp. TaxID=1912891 RepID=UPI002ED69C32